MTTLESNGLEELCQSLRCLPSVGPKSATKMVYHLLQNDRVGAKRLALALLNAIETIKHCNYCYTLTQDEVCHICQDTTRDNSQLCIVESPSDMVALERTLIYKGRYFVLMGHINPIEGQGPNQIGFTPLLEKIKSHKDSIKEIILATNFTPEGEMTAHLLAESLKFTGIRMTRLARGIPIGSELEFVDLATISHALSDRQLRL
ncbi:MAG: recombination mediator RecR [Gammaproteobacteria bacterium]|nr:recombination mediator RecR [Gammaproteobacteria bacterium]